MRSRTTNLLQIIVLLTGIIYIIIGLFFYISPINVLEFFAENFPEDWLSQMISDEIVAPLYFVLKGFSALLFSSGVAMVMPLFDPFKYRGLIYYNGVIFPLFASIMFLVNGFINSKSGDISGNGTSLVVAGQNYHLIVVILGIIFGVILILSVFGLTITKKSVKNGVE